MSRLAPSELLFSYDGTLEGFFSCVFDAYALHARPDRVCESRFVQPALGQELREVATDLAHAERVRAGLVRCGGRGFYRQVRTAFLSDEQGRELTIFDCIAKVLDEGPAAMGDLACPCVAGTKELVRAVLGERERMFQFLRFEELEGGVFFARIRPRANVIPIMMRHFVERFNTQPFLVYDPVHELVGAYDGRECTLVRADRLDLPRKTEGERSYQRLWKTFYDSISNEQRYNPDLRRSLMPKRFWADLPEMRLAVEERATQEG